MDQKCSKTVTFEGDMVPPPPSNRQNSTAKAKMTMKLRDYSSKNPFLALTNDDDDIEYGDVKPMGCTIGEIINIAKASNKNKKTKLHQKHDQKSAASAKPLNKKDILGCLMNQAPEVAGPNLCTNVHDDYEKIEVMVDSGASETVASQDKFTSYPLEETTASGTTYSSAAEKQAEDIVNLGQKYVQVVDENGSESWAKFQICQGLGRNRILGSVSRLIESGHTVVFRNPELGSYIQNNSNGYRTYLRQHNGSYFLDLWVKKMPQGPVQSAEVFPGQGM